jgi:SynChlorMet cassette radical SAM/SPASM protein ScmE
MIKRGELSAPFTVFLNVTNRCNLRCHHCSTSAGKALDHELTTEEWLALIRRLSEFKVFKVVVSGGEPLMRPDVFLLLEELDRRRIGVLMNSNATLIDDQVAARLAGFRMLRSFNVSLDGSCAGVHDPLRGEGAFDRALGGIEALLRHGLRVSIGAVVTRFNVDDLENMVRLAQDLGVSHISFGSLHPTGRTRSGGEVVWLTSEERSQVAGRLVALEERYSGFASSNFVSWYRKLSCPPAAGSSPQPIHVCGAAMESCSIRADGSVGVCNAAPDYACGNVRDTDLAWIWRRSPRMQAVRDLAKLTADDVEGCRECPYRFSCTTGCRADAWSVTGSWTGGPTAICWHYSDKIG